MSQNTKIILAIAVSSVLTAVLTVGMILLFLKKEQPKIEREIKESIRKEADHIFSSEYIENRMQKEAPHLIEKGSKVLQDLPGIIKRGQEELSNKDNEDVKNIQEKGAKLLKKGTNVLEEDGQELVKDGVSILQSGLSLMDKILNTPQQEKQEKGDKKTDKEKDKDKDKDKTKDKQNDKGKEEKKDKDFVESIFEDDGTKK